MITLPNMIRSVITLGLVALAVPLSAQMKAAKPTPALPKPSNVQVAITTTAGLILIELDRIHAPITAGNFLKYVDQKRFDGVSFYRRVQTPGVPDKGFIQGGTTDPKRVLPPIAHEPTTLTGLSHVDGALSAPRWAPGTARGDFTIIAGDAKWMDANPAAPGDNLGYAVFGRVIGGMDVIQKILVAPVSQSKGEGVMRGQMLEPQVKIITARRVPLILMPPPSILPSPSPTPRIN